MTTHTLPLAPMLMRRWLLLLSLVCALAPVPGFAQEAVDSAALYRAFGEKAGISALVDDFVNRMMVDPRIGHFFKNTKPANLKEQLADQFCLLGGGPCKYQGDSMKAAHADLQIRRADFNALVEVLQHSMDARGIPFAAQNRMLALLAPMHRDIITR